MRSLIDRYRRHRASNEDGQGLTEFAIILPVMLLLLLAILDFSRIYTTMLTIESAAREAADYGAFNSSNWIGDPADPASNSAKTVAAMTERACVASSTLTDFDPGSGGLCANPTMAWQLVDSSGQPANNCDDPDRSPEPCRVRVDLTFDFKIIAPFGFNVGGVRYGLPSTLNFTRTSIFAISDFEIDTP